MTKRLNIPGIASGFAVMLSAFAAGAVPTEPVTVAEWAAEKRIVGSESGSPFPGRWRNERAPYMVEPMECMTLSHPARSVTLSKSAQVAGTECGVNLFGYVVDQDPAPMMIVLPTLDEAKKYVRVKMTPTIDATPCLRTKVREQKSRDEDGSTTAFKKFRGGFCQITGANSSRGLQMISVRVLICEEISEWVDDADGRGDPLEQAEKRTTAWTDVAKKVFISTPDIVGTCRISVKYEQSDQRRLYVPCPHCGAFQVLVWKNLKWASESRPHRASYPCQSCATDIEHHHKRAMVTAGVWIKTYPDADGVVPPDTISAADIEEWHGRSSGGRDPGFHIYQLYSFFVSWDDTVAEWLKAKDDPQKEKVFTQQVLGEAYEEAGEAPDYEALMLRRLDYVPGRLPPGALVITGMADVQGNRLEWGTYAWGVGCTGWLIDRGIIQGDPETDDSVWSKLREISGRTYEDWQGKPWPIEAFGVDAGYLSNRVYNFTRTGERLFSLDGRPGHLLPFIGTPKKVDVNWQGRTVKGGVMLWPTGTHPLKSWVYGGLRKAIAGPDDDGNYKPGTLHFNKECDEEFFTQMTAEYLAEVEKKSGVIVREWRKMKNRANEQLDIVVGARALAAHLGLDRMTPEGWAELAAARGAPPVDVQRDLSALWAPPPNDSRADPAKSIADRLA